jgi:hypothetical protein
MNDELETIKKEAVVAQFRYYPAIYLAGLKKTMKPQVKIQAKYIPQPTALPPVQPVLCRYNIK